MKWVLILVLTISMIFPAFCLAQCVGGRCSVRSFRSTRYSSRSRVIYYRRPVVRQYRRPITLVRGQPIRNIGRVLFGQRQSTVVRRGSVLRKVTVEHTLQPIPQDLMHAAEGFHVVPRSDYEFAQQAGLCPNFLNFKPIQVSTEHATWRK